ncbi:MAG: DUF177 domain-containing protein [Nitrospirae bacterium]|nr:DUF177 domain-containing protein [Nitrospirota bacterium]
MTGTSAILEWGGGVPLGITMDLLTPKIADITAEGLSLSGDLTCEELGLTEADESIRGTLAVGLDLRSVERTICVTGVVEGTAVRQCVRCLKDFDDPVAFSVRVAYEREAKAAAPAAKRDDPRKKKATPAVEMEPEEQNDELYHYAGDHLELAPMLREQLILVSPMHPLCTEECLGLCARCGKDLNEGPCSCAAEPTSGPFQVLRSAKTKLRGPADRS